MPALSTSLLFGGLALCTPAVNVPAGGAVYCHAIGQTPATEQLNLVFAFDMATVQGGSSRTSRRRASRRRASGVAALPACVRPAGSLRKNPLPSRTALPLAPAATARS